MKKAEILAPAGSMESLIAAIEGGCDAVYLAGNLYGARSYATNFSDEELKTAIEYAHLYGVRVYVTVNILIYESEVKNFLKYIEYLQKINVDAVIVQDIGMMDLLKQTYPSLEIHASTQMHIHNLEGVKFAEKIGASRVVLARETPIELIQEIRNQTNLELEVFVHGALCISYSGQCLMSSLIGGRSGNRGTCAQCCRQPYKLFDNDKVLNQEQYVLSAKDLNTLEHIDELLEIGVDSLKIEGRMKRPEYVYLVTKIYREAVDSFYTHGKTIFDKNKIYELKKIFNREFTKGFIFHENNSAFINTFRPNHIGVKLGEVINSTDKKVTIKLSETLHVQDGIRFLMDDEDFGLTVLKILKKDRNTDFALSGEIVDIPVTKKIKEGTMVLKTTDSLQLKEIQNLIQEKKRKVAIKGTITIRKNKKIILDLTDDINYIRVEGNHIVEQSKNYPITEDVIKKQISKLGNTVYSLSKLVINCDSDVFVPVKNLNEIRRDAIEQLNEKRIYTLPIIKGKYLRKPENYELYHGRSIMIDTLEEYNKIKNNNYEIIYMSKDIYDIIDDERKILKIPRVLEHHLEYNQRLLVGEVGSVNKYSNVITDFSLNVVNSYSVALLHTLGVKKVTLSYELNKHQIIKLIKAYHERYKVHPNLEVIVAGKVEAMILKYRLLSNYKTKGKVTLQDKYKNNFSVVEKDNLTYIYHFKKLKVNDEDAYFDLGINWLRY